jgi:hypothetical protein
VDKKGFRAAQRKKHNNNNNICKGKSKNVWMNVNRLDRNNILKRNALGTKERRASMILNNKRALNNLDIHDTEWINKFKGNQQNPLNTTMIKKISMRQLETAQNKNKRHLKSANKPFNICSHSKCPDQCVLETHKQIMQESITGTEVNPNKKNKLSKFLEYMYETMKDNCCLLEIED